MLETSVSLQRRFARTELTCEDTIKRTSKFFILYTLHYDTKFHVFFLAISAEDLVTLILTTNRRKVIPIDPEATLGQLVLNGSRVDDHKSEEWELF